MTDMLSARSIRNLEGQIFGYGYKDGVPADPIDSGTSVMSQDSMDKGVEVAGIGGR